MTGERRTPLEPVALLLAGLVPPPVTQDDDARPSLAARAEALEAAAAAALPAPPAAPDHLQQLDARIEAVLVVATEALPLATIAAAVDRPVAVVRDAVGRIRADYDGEGGGRRRGFELRETAVGWRIYVRAEHDAVVRDLVADDAPARLSRAALETLAVIAYRQPVTRGRIAEIRAVAVDSVVRTLLSRGLIEEVGQDPVTGAVLYGTTDALLTALGIASLDALPPLSPLLAGAEEVGADAR